MSLLASFILPHPPLIIPEIGKGKEVKIRKTIDSCHNIGRQIKELAPETVIVISPHSVLYADYIHISPGRQAQGNLKQFGAPNAVSADYDVDLIVQLEEICAKTGFPAGTLGEKEPSLDHGILVPIYFINQYYTDYNLVRISVSGLSRQEHYRFGMILTEAVNKLDRKAVIIASGDLSHKLTEDGPYGFAPEGPVLDRQLVDIMKNADFSAFFEIDDVVCEKAAECGLASFVMMSGALDETKVKPEFLSYEGPFGVGYAVCAYKALSHDSNRNFLATYNKKNNTRLQSIRKDEDIFVRVARQALEGYVLTGKLPELPDSLPDDLRCKRAGVFVSIKKCGQLRGCIGTTEATADNIAKEIQRNAVSAGMRDPRFPPVRSIELSELVYSVDVLSEAHSITDRNMLDVKRYGVIVSSGYKRGLLLPNLDGIDTVDEQIEIACRKAGILENEDYTLKRFEVVRHK